MKQKFSILKDQDNKKLTIKEFSELDKDLYSLASEESYDIKTIELSIKKGKKSLISALRTKNIFPISYCANQIADAVINLFDSASNEPVEVLFNDLESIDNENQMIELQKNTDSVKIDELLEDNVDNAESIEQGEIKSISSSASSIKLAEDGSIDVKTED